MSRHGHSWRGGVSPTYSVWHSIKTRCFNPKSTGYANYGGRGITMHSEWAADFSAFLRDVGERPSMKHTIDRIDVDGNYEPGNCRWATDIEQHRNRRDNHLVEYQGVRITIAELVERTGLPNHIVRVRLKRGWSVERTITQPVKAWRQPRGKAA